MNNKLKINGQKFLAFKHRVLKAISQLGRLEKRTLKASDEINSLAGEARSIFTSISLLIQNMGNMIEDEESVHNKLKVKYVSR